jgi:hypothetical protein
MEGLPDPSTWAMPEDATAAETSEGSGVRRRKPRRQRLGSLVKEAKRAGLTVRTFTANPDGGLTVQVGEPDAKTDDLDDWLARRSRNARAP